MTITNCATPVPAIDYCIHSSKYGKFYCTNSKTKKRSEFTYPFANKYICVSPQHYNDIIDFISEVTDKAKMQNIDGAIFYE